MTYWTVVYLAIAVIAGILSFDVIGGSAATVSRFIFAVALMMVFFRLAFVRPWRRSNVIKNEFSTLTIENSFNFQTSGTAIAPDSLHSSSVDDSIMSRPTQSTIEGSNDEIHALNVNACCHIRLCRLQQECF